MSTRATVMFMLHNLEGFLGRSGGITKSVLMKRPKLLKERFETLWIFWDQIT